LRVVPFRSGEPRIRSGAGAGIQWYQRRG
jgi:hypothetical protein